MSIHLHSVEDPQMPQTQAWRERVLAEVRILSEFANAIRRHWDKRQNQPPGIAVEVSKPTTPEVKGSSPVGSEFARKKEDLQLAIESLKNGAKSDVVTQALVKTKMEQGCDPLRSKQYANLIVRRAQYEVERVSHSTPVENTLSQSNNPIGQTNQVERQMTLTL